MPRRNLSLLDSGPDKFCRMCLSLLKYLHGKPEIMSIKSTSVCKGKVCLVSSSVIELT